MVVGMIAAGAALAIGGGLMGKKGRRPGISPTQMASIERKSEAEGTLSQMFQERAKDPFQYVMPLAEQQYYDKRQADIYGEGRQRQQQSLMAAMSRTGTLASGATNYNLMRFGQETLRDKQQFYFQDRAQRLGEREQAVGQTFQMGMQFMGAPGVGGQITDAMNARSRQHNEWRNRWANLASSMGGQMMGYGLGQMAGKGGGGGQQTSDRSSVSPGGWVRG